MAVQLQFCFQLQVAVRAWGRTTRQLHRLAHADEHDCPEIQAALGVTWLLYAKVDCMVLLAAVTQQSWTAIG